MDSMVRIRFRTYKSLDVRSDALTALKQQHVYFSRSAIGLLAERLILVVSLLLVALFMIGGESSAQTAAQRCDGAQFAIPSSPGYLGWVWHEDRPEVLEKDKLKQHSGIDLWGPAASPIYAAYAGIVTQAERDENGDFKVSIEHSDRNRDTYYGHVANISKYIDFSQVGGKNPPHVERGQQIGEIGAQGHLHFPSMISA